MRLQRTLGLPIVALFGAVTTVTIAQSPGDRPAANPRATRSVVMARHGAIATSQPLASAAGLHVLASGGNAIDAAVTAAAVLSVVEPTMNGIGGDLFAIVHSAKTKQLHALNASGRAGSGATPEAFAKLGLKDIPVRGHLPVTVPGVVDGWSELLAKHGTISLAEALAPAIAYARDGFAVSEIIADQWEGTASVLARDPAASAVFLPGGRAPKPGRSSGTPRWRHRSRLSRRTAATSSTVAASAAPLRRTSRGGAGTLRPTISRATDRTGSRPSRPRTQCEVFQMPPNTQGIVALQMLNILEGFDLKALGHNTAEYCTCSSKPSASHSPTGTPISPIRTSFPRPRSACCSRRTTPRPGARRSIRPARPRSARLGGRPPHRQQGRMPTHFPRGATTATRST